MNGKKPLRLGLIFGAILILLNVAMINCGQDGVTGRKAEEPIIPAAGTPTLALQTSREAATTLPVHTATPIPKPVKMPVLLWEVQTPAIPQRGYALLETSSAGVFLLKVRRTAYDSPGRYTVTAFDRQTGEQKWSAEGWYKVPPWGNGPPMKMSVTRSSLFVGNQVLDPETGALKEEFDSSSSAGQVSIVVYPSFSPRVITVGPVDQHYAYRFGFNQIDILDLKTDEIMDSYPLPGTTESIAINHSENIIYVLVETDEASLILAVKLL